jgi:two-component system, NarL family, nitrate/nitrite sensor histidine kinase NarX
MMVFKSLQQRLILLFSLFALLMLISVVATVWGLKMQQQDALVINLTGRQRMLTQQMTRLAFHVGIENDDANAELEEVERTFDQTLSALLDGGSAPYLTDTTVTLAEIQDPGVRSALNQVVLVWDDYRTLLNQLQGTSRDDPSFAVLLQSIEDTSTILVREADKVVQLYEASATAKVSRLTTIQIGFFLCALALLVLGLWLTYQSALKPLRELAGAANRLGENELETPVQVEGPEEMRVLSQAFDSMRVRLRSSRQELVTLNERLEERVALRTRELETLNEVSREVLSRLDIQQVLNSVTEKARTLLRGEVASLCLVDEKQHWMKLQAISGSQNAVIGQVARADKDLAVAVLESDIALNCGIGGCYGGCRMLSEQYRASHLAAPLRIGERVIGALCVGSPTPDRFASESAEMLTKLANAAAIAVENAQLYAQAERVAALEERSRVAAEMHDGLGQTLSSLGLMTDQVVDFLIEGQEAAAFAHLKKTRETIEQASGNVRRAINGLMEETPSALDLCDRLRGALNEFATTYGMNTVWQPEVDSMPDCPAQVSEQVLNIMREALNNTARHAQARKVSVGIGRSEDRYFMVVEDDGTGFDMALPVPGGHYGLRIMQARAAHIGGRVEIEATPGRGTRVMLNWPANYRAGDCLEGE